MKDQLEMEMIEFILEIWQVKNSAEYAPSSLINCINLLSLYLLNHPDGNYKFTLSNKKEFRLLWSTLNGKLKKLKKSGNIVKHHDNLMDEEVQQIFQHKSISINDPQGLQYRIFMWCCLLFQPRGGEHYSIKIS